MVCPQVRGSQGEHTQVQDGLLDLSNKKRLGITEFHLVRQQSKSLTALIFYILKISVADPNKFYSQCNAESVPKEILTSTQFSVALCYNLDDSRGLFSL
jgi:hypothetical protein